MVPAGVLALVGSTLKGELMTKLMLAVGLLVGLVSVGSIGLAQQGKGEKDQAVAKVVSQTPAEKQIPASLEDRVKSLKAEWDAARDVYFKAMASAKTDAAKADVLKLDPDIVTYSRRFLTLAQTEIQNPAARDALLWILEQFWISDGFIGEWALIRDQAADLLIDFYGDDYRVARTALQMYRYLSPTRDRFLPALYEKAWSKPSKGAATLALAQYRWAESLSAFGRELVNQPVIRDDKGNIITMPAAMVAYHEMTYERDPAPLRAEAFRLLEEVIRDHSDESYDSRTGTTMGQKARDLFDEWANLSVGKPAPDFEGKTLEGQPVKLSDHRGKVVVLAFWASWCEPCVKQIAREKDIAARFKDRPFVIVGVNCDDDLEKAAKVAREQGMSWSSLFDRSKMTGPCEIDMGPVARLYHVNRLPSVLVLDGQGVIRHKLSGTQGLDQAVEELLNEPTKSSPAK
jgi:peroxiredoxin